MLDHCARKVYARFQSARPRRSDNGWDTTGYGAPMELTHRQRSQVLVSAVPRRGPDPNDQQGTPRLVVADDPGQTRRAHKLFPGSTTVLLQAAWVLACAYGLERSRISKALRGVLGLDGVSTDVPGPVAQALDWFDEGLDLADALHVATISGAGSFATFDERLVRKARRLGISAVALVPR